MARVVSKVVCAVLGAVLGSASGCTIGTWPTPEYGISGGTGGVMADYGMPYARYILSGTVTNAADSQPLEGIQVAFGSETTLTDADGAWGIDTSSVFPCYDSCELDVSDVDGATNGAFVDTTVSIDPTQTATGSSWDEGTYEQSDIEIELDEQ